MTNRRREAWTLAAGVTGVTLVIAASRAAPRAVEWRAARLWTADSLAREVATTRAVMRSRTVLASRVRDDSRRRAVLDVMLVHAASPTAAAGVLAAIVEERADEHRVQIDALQLRADSARAGLVRAAVRITGATDVAGLAGFLRAVECCAPVMVARELTVASPEPGASDERPESLRIDVVIEALAELGSAGRSSAAVPADTGMLVSELESREEAIVSNDVFRFANHAATNRFVPSIPNGVVGFAGTRSAAHPTLTLKAIVGGPPWQAIVDGIPGQPAGTIVRAGATFDQLTATTVARDSVVIRGPDTTWVLTFRGRS